MATSGQNYAYGSLWGMGLSSIVNAFGSSSISKHNNAIAQAQANIARINAQMMEFQAQQRLKANTKEQLQLTMKAGKVKSSQRAALAANGIAVGEGSAAELQASTDIVKEIDSNQLRENAYRDAWGLRLQGVNYEGQALSYEATKTSPGLSFGTTLLQGASQVATNYAAFRAMGLLEGQGQQNPAPIINKNFYR